ncbi:DsbC family protein [Denitromonas iodatirespirans]|uniref:Thiol:disulfide interchange protein n=1 Tax=Denitromonas iodatirespirans TaxID=2795389 RepID=A0A944H6M3_DENI1|nr:DsbC family protein [Denitromonas iodatirespirans]MBT0960324.1 DsbC family protein [Denitromonas iodatirespirans]
MNSRHILQLAASALLMLTLPAHAETLEARIKAGIAEHTGGGVRADAVRETPAEGIYEVVSGQQVFYVDRSGRYALIDGRMVDMRERRDLTAERLAELQHMDFKALPLNLAIKTIRGDGSRKLAVFEDPSCPVCRGQQDALAGLDDVTLYVFTYPVIAPASIPAAVATWCAPEASRAGQWAAFMRGAPLPLGIAPECRDAGDAVGRIVEFGQAHAITNTPTMFLADGTRLVGEFSAAQLAEALNRAGR